MAQKTTQTAQNAPQTPAEAPQSANTETGTIRQPVNLFTLASAPEGRDAQSKQQFMGDIRQKLAEVADEAKRNGEEATETENLAASAATRLFFARRNGVISGDELSGLLGDVFGYNPKQDGTPGKTPSGAGSTIRKRIVRALQGWDYVNGGDGGRFFDGMDKASVAPVINSIGRVKEVQHTNPDGTVTVEKVPDGPSVWSAYKLLGDIKSEMTVRVEMAFDPKKIAGLTEKLSEAGARDKLIGNPSLVKAYGALFDQLQILSHVDATEAETIKQRLGVVPPVAENEPEPETVTETGAEEMAA